VAAAFDPQKHWGFASAWAIIIVVARRHRPRVPPAASMSTPFAKTDKALTIREVAEAAGVSVGTVSRVLNAPTTVRPATLEKVRAVIDRLGFQPDPRAQNMRRRTTMTIGFIINDITNPMHSNVFKAAEAELRPTASRSTWSTPAASRTARRRRSTCSSAAASTG
jgi:transcriptional regulator with XRE-family HTH domain